MIRDLPTEILVKLYFTLYSMDPQSSPGLIVIINNFRRPPFNLYADFPGITGTILRKNSYKT